MRGGAREEEDLTRSGEKIRMIWGGERSAGQVSDKGSSLSSRGHGMVRSRAQGSMACERHWRHSEEEGRGERLPGGVHTSGF